VGIPGSEEADIAAKESLDEYLEKFEEYPLQDLPKLITKQQQRKSEQADSEMRNRKQQ
jgi:hypothetical protein